MNMKVEFSHLRDYNNYKPYRPKALKERARLAARKCGDGAWRSPVQTMIHSYVRDINQRPNPNG